MFLCFVTARQNTAEFFVILSADEAHNLVGFRLRHISEIAFLNEHLRIVQQHRAITVIDRTREKSFI